MNAHHLHSWSYKKNVARTSIPKKFVPRRDGSWTVPTLLPDQVKDAIARQF